MKKGDILKGKVVRVDFPNKGIVEIEGEEKKVVVKNTIPGQILKLQINKIKHGKPEARVLDVIEDSPLEVADRCKDFGVCGGCVYQSMAYEHQLSMKENQVRDLLGTVINYDYEFDNIKPSPICEGYRNKMEYSFGDEYKDGPMALGMHKRGSFYDIVTVDDCHIVNDDFNKILSATLEYAKESNLPFLHKMTHEGFYRHLLVRRAVKTKEILVCLVTTSQHTPDLTGFVEKLSSLSLEGKIVGILHILNDSLADVVKSDETRILMGQDYFYEDLLGLRFKITPFSFFQTNSLGAEVLYSTARDYIGDIEGKLVFDLYSGTGTIAQIVAPVAKKVIGVEIIEEAVVAARENAKLNNLDNCEFIAGDVLKVLDEVSETPEMIILDPPRDGIHPKALNHILSYNVPNIVYISCKLSSLVRDLEMFHENGYKVVKATCVDMFPGTANVETVVLLSH